MVDIVERLREIQEYKDGSDIEVDVSVWKPCYAGEAADEIEYLREKVDELELSTAVYKAAITEKCARVADSMLVMNEYGEADFPEVQPSPAEVARAIRKGSIEG